MCLFGKVGPHPLSNHCVYENEHIISLLTCTAKMKERVCGLTDVFICLPGTINSIRNSVGHLF